MAGWGGAGPPQTKCTERQPRGGGFGEIRGKGVSGVGMAGGRGSEVRGWAGDGRFLAVELCDLIHLSKRSLWLRLENGLEGGRRCKARGFFCVLGKARGEARESLGRKATAGRSPLPGVGHLFTSAVV